MCRGISCLHVFLCTMCVLGAHKGQKVAMDPLELELQTDVGHHVGAVKGIQVHWKSNCS